MVKATHRIDVIQQALQTTILVAQILSTAEVDLPYHFIAAAQQNILHIFENGVINNYIRDFQNR